MYITINKRSVRFYELEIDKETFNNSYRYAFLIYIIKCNLINNCFLKHFETQFILYPFTIMLRLDMRCDYKSNIYIYLSIRV